MFTASQMVNASAILRPSGRITAAGADDFREQLLELIASGTTDLTIDLTDVEMIDSRGLGVFIACHQALQPRNGKMRVIAPGDGLRQLFRAMRLDERFPVLKEA